MSPLSHPGMTFLFAIDSGLTIPATILYGAGGGAWGTLEKRRR